MFIIKRLFILLPLVIVSGSLAEWHEETVAPTLSHQLSIQLDSSGTPHVAYIDNETVHYGYWNGSGWELQVVDTAGFDNVYTSLALGSDDNPHIAYYAFNGSLNTLRYARLINNTWVIENLDFNIINSDFLSIAVDEYDQAYIAYRDAHFGDGTLRCIFFYDCDWHRGIVDNSGRNPSIKVNYPGSPGISYYDPVMRVLKYARYTGSWQTMFVDYSGDTGYYSSLAIDSNHNPKIVYFDSANLQIKYAQYEATVWSIESVDMRNDVGYFCSVALDANDTPHFSYTYAEEPEGYFEIIYAYKAGGSYHKQVVLGSDGMASMSPIALDDDSQPHILYSRGLGNPTLNYIWREGSAPVGQGTFTAKNHAEGVLLSWSITGDTPASVSVLRGLTQNGSVSQNDTVALSGALSGSATSWLDVSAEAGVKYAYYLEVTELDGTVSHFGPSEIVVPGAVSELTLSDPFPNPASSALTVSYELATDGAVSLNVYDLSGRLVETLVSGNQTAGRHSVSWDSSTSATGVYLLRLEAAGEAITKRAVVSR